MFPIITSPLNPFYSYVRCRRMVVRALRRIEGKRKGEKGGKKSISISYTPSTTVAKHTSTEGKKKWSSI